MLHQKSDTCHTCTCRPPQSNPLAPPGTRVFSLVLFRLTSKEPTNGSATHSVFPSEEEASAPPSPSPFRLLLTPPSLHVYQSTGDLHDGVRRPILRRGGGGGWGRGVGSPKHGPCPRVVRADAEVLKSTGGWDHGSSGLGCARIASERSEDVLKGRQAVLRVGWAKLVFSDLNTHPELQS